MRKNKSIAVRRLFGAVLASLTLLSAVVIPSATAEAGLIELTYSANVPSIHDPSNLFGLGHGNPATLNSVTTIDLSTPENPLTTGDPSVGIYDGGAFKSATLEINGNVANVVFGSSSGLGITVMNDAPYDVWNATLDTWSGSFVAGPLAGFNVKAGAITLSFEDDTLTALLSDALVDPSQPAWSNDRGAHWSGWVTNPFTGEERVFSVTGLIDLASFSSTPVPEPATLALLSLGLAGIGYFKRRKLRG